MIAISNQKLTAPSIFSVMALPFIPAEEMPVVYDIRYIYKDVDMYIDVYIDVYIVIESGSNGLNFRSNHLG